MNKIKTLSQLSYDDFKNNPAWESIGDYTEDEDTQLAPVKFDEEGRIPKYLKEVWCLCITVFANKTEHMSTAMCRGDSSDGPLLWSVWNGCEYVPLLLPPAPPHVLAKKGPDFFSNKFNLKKEEVFPLTIKVVPHFASSPEIRSIKLEISGLI